MIISRASPVTRLKKKSTMTNEAARAIWRVAEVAVAVMGTIITYVIRDRVLRDPFPLDSAHIT